MLMHSVAFNFSSFVFTRRLKIYITEDSIFVSHLSLLTEVPYQIKAQI